MNTGPDHPTPIRWRVFPAIPIVAIGALFLANNLGYHWGWFEHGNWWAILILLAAPAPLTRAYEAYRARAAIDAEVAYNLLSASAIVLVASLFLLDLDWGTWWPLFVILGGLYTLVPHRRHCRAGSAGHVMDDATIKH